MEVFGNSLRWEDLGWLCSPIRRHCCAGALVLRGVQHPDDVQRTKDDGIDGRYCSNHGGCQANGGLPAVVEAAEGTPVI